jgi:cellobiose PTS system EIIA component
MDEKLAEVSMQIILQAGDAREAVNHALDSVKSENFEQAKNYLKQAHEFIRLAHGNQTDIIQGEARGNKSEPSLLFNHAQDTIMTVMSEMNLAEQLVALFEIYDKKIESLRTE